jgi:hypothetical protein
LFILVLVTAFSYWNLDYLCTFNISTDKQSYNAGEVVEINCIINNPLPIPVYYRGHRVIDVEMSYRNGVKIQRSDLPIAEARAQRAAEEARAAAGGVVHRGFLRQNSGKIVKTVIYTPPVEGEGVVNVEYSGVSRSFSSSTSIIIEEYSPREVSINSTGITLFLEGSGDVDRPTILIRVRNDNPYPVRFPVFDELTKNYGSPDSVIKITIYLSGFPSFFEVPSFSTITIYDTDSQASDNTPIYFKLYGLTLRYPPLTDLNAYIMVDRFSYSSNSHSIVTITDEILEDYPLLKEAFQVETNSQANGLAHPVEWVVCSYAEGKVIEDLINTLPSTGEGTIRLEYRGVKYNYNIKFGKDPPIIS